MIKYPQTRQPVALYVDPERGPYPRILGSARCWGVERDGKSYAGDAPVVAHPPCKTWGKFAWRVAELDWAGHTCGPAAVAQVRKNGGVLEHPVGSGLWRECGLPMPGDPPDDHGGYTIQVNQCDWGHPALKPTLLYIVGVERDALPPMPEPRQPTHCIVRKRSNPHTLPELSKKRRHITPPAFAWWLVTIASLATQP